MADTRHPKVVLTYFDFSASRGEECRLALHLAGVPFTDERVTKEQWADKRASAPFAALPYLTVEGHAPIAQSNTILRFIGRAHGLLPTDLYEAARLESLMDAVEDMRGRMGPIARLKDPEEKRQKREEASRDYLPQWAAQVERHLAGEGPFANGRAISVADLKLYVALTPFLKGEIDHVPASVFDGSPRLKRMWSAVHDHPGVKSWQKRG